VRNPPPDRPWPTSDRAMSRLTESDSPAPDISCLITRRKGPSTKREVPPTLARPAVLFPGNKKPKLTRDASPSHQLAPTATIPSSSATSSPRKKPRITRLGEFIARDTCLYYKLGWKQLVRQRCQHGDLGAVKMINHPATRLLQQLKQHKAPVILETKPWSRQRLQAALQRGPHKSALEYQDFLVDEFADMASNGMWIVLPWTESKNLQNLCLSPPGCVPQRERQPRLIANYTFSGVNQDTVQVTPPKAMQFGGALTHVIHGIVYANPEYGAIRTMKVDIADNYYRIWVQPNDIPKLTIVLPPLPGTTKPLVALPMDLPMGWVESPPQFCTAAETAADLANKRLLRPTMSVPHIGWNVPPIQSPISPPLHSTPLPAIACPTLLPCRFPQPLTPSCYENNGRAESWPTTTSTWTITSVLSKATPNVAARSAEFSFTPSIKSFGHPTPTIRLPERSPIP
jgi:hypothetical protein